MSYKTIDVVPDTPEWLEERRKSLGASEVAGVLGLSPYMTPLSVYRSKQGIDDEFDPELAYIGHAEESVIEGWIRKFRPHQIAQILPAFMARSVEYPWLHASFDRLADHAGLLAPIQMKTAHQYAAKDWENGVPLAVQAQIQTEILVLDAPFGWAVVFIGGRKFHLHRVERDQEFIDSFLIPRTRDFWTGNVEAEVAPEPTTLGEVYEVYPSDPDTVIIGSEAVLDAADRRAVLLSDIKAQQAEADALTLAIAQYMGTNETLVGPDGPVLTYKTQKGRRRVADLDELEAEHPEYVTRGSDFKVMRATIRRTKKEQAA